MTNQKKVAIIRPDTNTINMFIKEGWAIVTNPADADLIQFTGGSDVTPSYYGAAKHARTWNDPERDAVEADIFHKYSDKPMAGICRGGQFLNVMHGGSMWQHINGHMAWHNVDWEDGNKYLMSSDHHQMMRPTDKAHIIATAFLSSFRETEDGKNVDPDFEDIEVVYYDGALCYQPHPEYVGPGHDCYDQYFVLLKQYLSL
jgi:gamma-glutamyl-gamma-aminobutyrate hydrolase PuuD